MGKSVNKVLLIGNIGNDPEIHQVKNGDGVVANLSVATTSSYKDKSTGEYVDTTEWHRVVAFKKLAEIVQQYMKKGMQVYVEGRNQTRKWQDKDGNDRYTTEVVAHEILMLGNRAANGGSNMPAPAPQAAAVDPGII